MKKKILDIVVDLLLITVTFMLTDWAMLHVLHSEKFILEMFVYVVFYALLFGAKHLVLSAWEKHRKNG